MEIFQKNFFFSFEKPFLRFTVNGGPNTRRSGETA